MLKTHPLRFFVFFTLALYLFLAAFVGSRANWDTADGYDFLVETRRGTGAEANAPINWERPRALVAVLMLVDGLYHAGLSGWPPVNFYHVLMASVSTLFLALWYFYFERLFGEMVAAGAILAVMMYRALFLNAFFCVSDALAGVFFVLALQVFLNSPGLPRGQRRAWFAVCLAMVALCKHQEFIFPAVAGALVVVILYFRKWAGAKELVFFTVDTGVYWAITVEFFYRVTTHFEEGFLTYVKYLDRKSRWALVSHDLTPKTVYLQELVGNYGGILVALAFVALCFGLYLILRRRRAITEFVLKQDPSFLIAVGTTTVFLVLNQRIPNREARYLIPFLPVTFALVALAVVQSGKLLPATGRYVWVLVWLLLFIKPVKEASRAIFSFYQQTQFAENRVGIPEFWTYLRDPSDGVRCRRIWACEGWGYDVGPGAYQFYTGVTPRFKYCPNEIPADQLKRHLTARDEVGDCFILRHPEQVGLEVQKLSQGEAVYAKQFFN